MIVNMNIGDVPWICILGYRWSWRRCCGDARLHSRYY
jgi:hypothetical protein